MITVLIMKPMFQAIISVDPHQISRVDFPVQSSLEKFDSITLVKWHVSHLLWWWQLSEKYDTRHIPTGSFSGFYNLFQYVFHFLILKFGHKPNLKAYWIYCCSSSLWNFRDVLPPTSPDHCWGRALQQRCRPFAGHVRFACPVFSFFLVTLSLVNILS